MKTIKNYQVRNTINDELNYFDTLELANDFVKSEIKWWSSKRELQTGTGYDESDFIIDENITQIDENE